MTSFEQIDFVLPLRVRCDTRLIITHRRGRKRPQTAAQCKQKLHNSIKGEYEKETSNKDKSYTYFVCLCVCFIGGGSLSLFYLFA